MTWRVHPFLFLHVGAVLFPIICERSHGSRFIWILHPQYSLPTVCFAFRLVGTILAHRFHFLFSSPCLVAFVIIWQHHWLPSIVRHLLDYRLKLSGIFLYRVRILLAPQLRSSCASGCTVTQIIPISPFPYLVLLTSQVFCWLGQDF